MNNKVTQLSLFGLSENQTHFTTSRWGVLTFFPADKMSQDKRCRHCLLRDWHTQSCTLKPFEACCRREFRSDWHDGYYSIHQFPSL